MEEYPWSGHRAMVGKASYEWMDRERVLAEFGGKGRKSVSQYRRFVREGIGEERDKALTGGGLVRSLGGWSQVLGLRGRNGAEEWDERVLGSGEFVEGLLREAEELQLRQMRLRKRGKGIEDIIREESEKEGVKAVEVMKGSRRRRVSRVRMTIATRCKEEIGLSGAEIARYLGVNTSSVNRRLAKLERL